MARTRPGALENAFAIFVRATAIFLPELIALGVLRGGIWTFTGAFIVFGLLTVIEGMLTIAGVGSLTSPGGEEVSVLGRAPRAQLWVYAFGHLLLVPFVLYLVARGHLSTFEMIGAGISLASMGGTTGGLGGHELMHKRSAFDRFLGIGCYATANYGHFISSHVFGHHVNVGRRDDWGTARRGESIYAFLYRAVFDGYVGGFRIEGEKLKRKGLSPWSLRNFILRYTLFTLAVWIGLGVYGGLRTLVFFGLTSVLTIAFMELFNYISHYALVRPVRSETGAVPIEPQHTWESNNKVVNWFIFNAGMHGAHHQKPAHGFEDLMLFHHQDYIPHGIAGMAFVSFVPPLYLSRMERILEKREAQALTVIERA